jgi:putative PEP-CTERM system histidine kinase
MAIIAIIIVSSLINVLCCCLLLFKQSGRRLYFALPVVLLCLVAPLYGLAGKALLTEPIPLPPGILLSAFLTFSFVFMQMAIEMLSGVLSPARQAPAMTKGIAGRFSTQWVTRLLAVAGLLLCLAFRGHEAAVGRLNDLVFVLGGVDIAIFSIRLLLDLALLLVLENIYRYAKPHQQRKGRIAFFGFILLAVFDTVFSAHSLLFSTLSGNYIGTSIVVCGICLPLGLFGLVRYRLAEEKIFFSPASIYSSFTLLLAGTLFLVLGGTVGVLQSLGIRFSYFEEFIGAFFLLVIMVLAATSPRMRIRLGRLINKHLYRSKHNYRDQFFRLHRTYMAGERLQDSIDILLENLTHDAALGEALVFLREPKDGNFYLQRHLGAAAQEAVCIGADSPLVSLFENDESPCLFSTSPSSARVALAQQEPAVARLDINALFPVKHQKELLGFLAIRRAQGSALDEEDIELIRVFTVSMGNVYFKYRIQEERVELKQFESFNHIASFIVHDIKNQVATLSLLSKNAESNIGDPDFQKSLIRSLRSCCGNLEALIGKMAAPVRQKELAATPHDVNHIVSDVLNEGGLETMTTIRLESRLRATKPAIVDRDSLFYIVKNLVINALEAMNGSGTLTIAAGDLVSMPADIRSTFGVNERTFTRNSVYILVCDTGVGMSRQFIETKLFRPFISTKDKGIGIGLYQCRVLIEKMDGALRCRSQEGAGSEFCVIV